LKRFDEGVCRTNAYRCPSSHSDVLIKMSGSAQGPVGDYVACVAKNDLNANWGRYYSANITSGTATKLQSTFVGPFKIPQLEFFPGVDSNTDGDNTSRSITNWTLNRDMSAWCDGTSNQWCFVEKFIPGWARNRDDALGNAWDGGIQWTYPNSNATQGGCSVNIGRIVSQHANLFARGENDPGRPNDSTNQYPGMSEEQQQLGSSHLGVVNVLLGDGSVRGASVTMLPVVAARFSHVQDGVSVSMP
ncbi:MAG: DUF1559 domain-containing protein, partial [Planctomycetaceae bacterium]|nr:DUF1559 domain-containing protein [Planctomycetaceae bacterium]